MALTVTAGGARGGVAAILSSSRMMLQRESPHQRHLTFSLSRRTTLHIASAKKFSPRTGRFNRRNNTATEDQEKQQDEDDQLFDGSRIERTGPENSVLDTTGGGTAAGILSTDGKPMPDLPGAKPDFWEGPQWDAFGFFVQYLWAFGILFSIGAIGVAVSTYNEGAADFKETPAYKESIKSQELLEEPDANSDVFESNPTEVAPSLD